MSREKRAIVYIDGFNLYHGMKEKYGRRYSWLNLHEFAKSLIPMDAVLVRTKYFTSRIKGDIYDPTKHLRQAQYLKAVNSLYPTVIVIKGTYQVF
jgi:hypothetical protein